MNAKVFTIESGSVTEGAKVEMHALSGGMQIPAIFVGEEGRGRDLGVLMVSNAKTPCPNRSYRSTGKPHHESKHSDGAPGPEPESTPKCEFCGVSYFPWVVRNFSGKPGSAWVSRHPNDQGEILPNLLFANVAHGESGRVKLIAASAADTDECAILILRTTIGFRGGNDHTGDRLEPTFKLNSRGLQKMEILDISQTVHDSLSKILYKKHSLREKTLLIEIYGLEEGDFDKELQFHPFPGEVLIEGIIAQGTAGNMGSGTQLVAVVKKGEIFRTSYSGRLYGAPSAHYYLFDGQKIRVATWDEREMTDDEVFKM